jgi:hypothetical protein
MHPSAFEQYMGLKRRGAHPQIQRMMEGAQHFLVSSAMHEFAIDLFRHESSNPQAREKGLCMPITSRLPADVTCLTVETPQREDVVFLASSRRALGMDGDGVCLSMVGSGFWFPMATFLPGSDYLLPLIGGDGGGTPAGGLSNDDLAQVVTTAAFILSLVNTPRKVVRTESRASRPQARLMERELGRAPAAYFRIGWELGKPVDAEVKNEGIGGWRQALHWVRPHFANAKEGEPKAEWLNLPTKGGWGWYRWVADCWKGHPDFGTRLHHYDPGLPGDRRPPGAQFGFTASSPERMAMMDAAKRAALQQAGFAA